MVTLMTPKRVLKKIERVVRQGLEEQFKNEYVFDPIVVASHEDPFGDERVHVYVVYNGKGRKPGPLWTAGLIGYIQEHVSQEELPLMPMVRLFSKRDWKSTYAKQVEQWTRGSY